MSRPIIAYYRVSTPRQGRSGLGLEAQRKAVAQYALSSSLTIAEEFIEIETGKGSDALEKRPVFAAALRKAKKLKAPLVVAKLDRLSRDVAFISGLMSRGTQFISVDDPHASTFVLHIKASVAEEERRMISQRTKDALAAARERGVELGNPNLGRMVTEATAARDAILKPILQEMWEMPLRDIAAELTARNIPTPRGGDAWSPMTVMRAMKRLGIAGR
jgi:DNA invertase Pin-like site-specific DNA recombinase